MKWSKTYYKWFTKKIEEHRIDVDQLTKDLIVITEAVGCGAISIEQARPVINAAVDLTEIQKKRRGIQTIEISVSGFADAFEKEVKRFKEKYNL